MNKNLILMIISLLIIIIVYPAIGNEWDDLRNHETIIFTGQYISQYLSVPVDQIFLYSYREQDNSWRQITSQIDELDGDAGYFNSNYNGTVDNVDEFVFMARDAGDYAPATSWIDDADSKQYIRYQIEIVNPDDPTTKKYIYLFRSTVLTDEPDLPVYIEYVAPSSGASDTVKAIAYLEGHNSRGIPDVWRVADSTGIYGFDFLDRQKARVKGTYKPLPFISISYNMNENDLQVERLQYKRGPIRIIRDVTYKSEVSGISISVGTFRYRYYPYHIISLGATRKLESDYGVKLIRQSFDLSSNAIGMLFDNTDNFNIVIDGAEDPTVNRTIYPSPTMNWYSYSGSSATIVVLNEFTPPASASYSLYYHESLTNSTGDGTSDTGDGKSYGDVGIMFQGNNMNGSISLPYYNYFLPGSHPREVAARIASLPDNQLRRNYSTQNYIAPTQLAISLPDTSGPAQYSISIPVLVGSVTGLNIRSSQLVIQFDSQILEATGVTTENTLISNWSPPAVTIANDTIYLDMNGTSNLQGSGVLVYLNFKVIGIEGQQSPLRFLKAKFNTWSPLAVVTDGLFTTLPIPEVLVAVPDSHGNQNTEVLVPIQIGEVTGLNITRCTIELLFGKSILDAIAISTNETLAAGWSDITFTDRAGSVKIEMSGVSPLTGQGTLIWIKFKVIGNPGQTTNISFNTMIFNEGVPLARTQSGRFNVNNPMPIDVLVSIPDTTLRSGDTLHIPVKISNIADVQISHYNMQLSFNPEVLEFKGVDTTSTVTWGWDHPAFRYILNDLSITASGTVPVQNEGALIYLDFDVIGPDGSTTTIHFSDMTFNWGNYMPVTQDGTIQVNGVVPVELSSFSANVIDGSVKLEWATTTESNNFGFFIQRRADIATDWQTIGFVPGKGTIAVPQHYSFNDTDVQPGIWNYRLQQQDFDGKTSYSKVIVINLLPGKYALDQNYPNPFNSSTSIKYELPAGEHRIKLVIYDLLGHRILTLVNEKSQPAGVYRINWDGRDDAGQPVASGVYFFQLLAGNQNFIKKMLLIE